MELISKKRVHTSTFSSYQQDILHNLSFFGLTRHKIWKNNKINRYKIGDSSPIALLVHYLITSNTLAKVAYIFYLAWSKLTEMEFLDKLSVALLFLVFCIMTLSIIAIWFQRYPFYEILHEFWTIEDEIYKNLGYPSQLKRKVEREQRTTIWVHLAITFVGCVCYIIQYYGDPKYCTFTYALIEQENWLLWGIFGIHEFLFMQHAWCGMTSCGVILTFHAIILENFMIYLTNTANELYGEVIKRRKRSGRNETYSAVKAPGTEYNITKLFFDYRQLIVITESFNSYMSYKTVFLHACGYCQFISDVFLAVQVLRLPGTNVLDIWFYIEDSMASMYMIYRVYKFMSRVETQSTDLFRGINLYLEFPTKERKELQKVARTMKCISLKLGPCPVTPETVLNAMDMLSGYYICVALWE